MKEHADRQQPLFAPPPAAEGGPPLVRIARLAAMLARRHMAEHPHPYAPKKFTRPQLFACLIFKAHLGCTYRRAEELLILMPDVREAIGLRRVPRFTTLQAFADRPEIMSLIDAVLADIGRAIAGQRPQDAAIDGTGLEVTSASAHFVSRAGRTRTKYVKVLLGVLCASVNSAIKRIGGCMLRSHKPSTLFAEAALKVAADAIKVRRGRRAGRVLD